MAQNCDDRQTLGKALYWAYANVAMAHVAIKENAKCYSKKHLAIRKTLYGGLFDGSKRIRSLFDDEKIKMCVSTFCCYCASTIDLTTEHILSRKRGGSDSGDNLMAACKRCNSSKRDKDMLIWLLKQSIPLPVLLVRRYLKLAIEHASAHNLLDIEVSQLKQNQFPFELCGLPSQPIDLTNTVLWAGDVEHLPKGERGPIYQDVIVANWNLERPKQGAKLDRALAKIATISPDILVITENTTAVDGLDGYSSLHCDIHSRSPKDYSASIFSKWPIREKVFVTDPVKSVCALLDTPFGDVLVFGCIIPYKNAGLTSGKYGLLGYKSWQMHKEMIEVFKHDWIRIQADYPNTPFIIMGDFNQTRGTLKGYGTHECRTLLSEALMRCKLSCITEIDFSNTGQLMPDAKGKIRKNIDHICVNSKVTEMSSVYRVSAWDHFNDLGQLMSDHNGVKVDLSIRF